jgi:hypothetical protein
MIKKSKAVFFGSLLAATLPINVSADITPQT